MNEQEGNQRDWKEDFSSYDCHEGGWFYKHEEDSGSEIYGKITSPKPDKSLLALIVSDNAAA